MKIVFLTNIDKYYRFQEVDLHPTEAHKYLKGNYATEINTKKRIPKTQESAKPTPAEPQKNPIEKPQEEKQEEVLTVSK